MPLHSNKNKLSSGYILAKDYIEGLRAFDGNGFWKLPLSFIGSLDLFVLKILVSHSWFADSLYVKEFSKYGLGYQQLFYYIKDNLGDVRLERNESDLQVFHIPQWRLLLRKSPNLPYLPFSFGTDLDNKVAISKTLGEGLERYCTIHKNFISKSTDLELTYSQALNKKHDICFPQKYHQYTDYQKSKNISLYKLSDSNITWARGVNALTMKTALIPKQLISKQFQKLLVPKEGFMNEFNTSGAAGWFTLNGAVTRGIFELIQRDAFMVAWLTKAKIDEIAVDSIQNELTLKIIRKIESAKCEVHIYKLESIANVPSVLVAVFDKAFKKEQVYVTAHADMTFESAILGALQEVLPFFYERQEVSFPNNYEPFVTNSINRSFRMNLCKVGEMVNSVRNLSSGRRISIKELDDKNLTSDSEEAILKELVNRLSSLGDGYTPYFYEYQDNILKNVGYHVVKCFVPKLFPLYLSDNLATISSSRLGTFDEECHEEILKVLQNYPHPFA